jgi:glycosyltransferase involved in cell wall biosynthesis
MASVDRLRFSVVIPAFNEASYLPETLASLAEQDFGGGYEVIVVDNNSSDDTASVAASCGARVVHEPRPGVCYARQRGTEESSGEIVVSTDADTTFSPSWLSSIDRAFLDRPDCVAVAGPCRFDDAPWWGRIYPILLFGVISAVACLTGRVLYVTATNISFRRSAFDGYDTRLTQGGDELDLLRRLRYRGEVPFLRANPTLTSSRRLQRGLWYNVFVSFFFYYVLAYSLNRIAHRTLLATAPIFRSKPVGRKTSMRVRAGVALSGLCLMAGVVATPFGRDLGPGLEASLDALQRLI